jgi:hypothetical protein
MARRMLAVMLVVASIAAITNAGFTMTKNDGKSVDAKVGALWKSSLVNEAPDSSAGHSSAPLPVRTLSNDLLASSKACSAQFRSVSGC